MSRLKYFWDFPGGPVVNNMSCNAGDMGWIPGQTTKAPHATGQLSPHSTSKRGTHTAVKICTAKQRLDAAKKKIHLPSLWGWCDYCCCFSVTQACLTLCKPMELQHTRLPYPSPSPGACSHSCPLSQWCHPTISSAFIPFSSWLLSFTASVFSNESALFASGGPHQSFQ